LARASILGFSFASDPLPEWAFDLVHCRLVLVHLPQRDLALTRMVSALKPGRLLPGRLRDSGLVNIHAEGRVVMWSGASPFADHHKANFDQLRRDMIGAGLITEEEFERDRARLDDPRFFRVSSVMWTVLGTGPLRRLGEGGRAD
jgi:hypothetical protein